MVSEQDIPAEAVEAVLDDRSRRWEYDKTLDPALARDYRKAQVPYVLTDLAAALPHLHERWLAEVEGALRDHNGYWRWLQGRGTEFTEAGPIALTGVATYLRDVLGAGAGGEG
jgi:hypothetical protein